ncbi:MAG: glycosyltransferase family 2 protein, partial [Ilumatobacteraceae bacterium]
DDTWGAIEKTIGTVNPSGSQVTAYKQTGIGKGDAVRLGFAKATGDILIILDADLSVPPEELPRFIRLLQENRCEFANGSRLVYPMEKQAMQFLNLIGNRLFGIAFSYLLGQPVRDTLCGTKALWSNDYRRIADQRSHFGDFDPFGDFDLLFGAARLHLKIRDVPVHYKERVYGSTNISRFRHGLMLLRMTAVAARKLRFI